MAHGRRTDEDIREEIAALYARGVRGVTAIRKRLEDDPRFKERVPSDRSISRVLQQIRAQYPPEQQRLDRPWQLRSVDRSGLFPDGITPEAVPDLLECRRLSAVYHESRPFTIRDARWVCVLRHAVKGQGSNLLNLATTYADRERWAAVSDTELDTGDLDGLLSFAPWRSDTSERVYKRAVNAGRVPRLDSEAVVKGWWLSGPRSNEASTHRGDEGLVYWIKSLFASAVLNRLHDSLPEDNREEFWLRADQIIRGPEEWTSEDIATGSVKWTADPYTRT